MAWERDITFISPLSDGEFPVLPKALNLNIKPFFLKEARLKMAALYFPASSQYEDERLTNMQDRQGNVKL